MHNLASADKTLEIPYSVEKIKLSIKTIIAAGSAKYKFENINDAFSTYAITVLNGFSPAMLDITLSEIEAEKTKIIIVGKPYTGSKASVGGLQEMINAFLNLLSMELSGAKIDSAIVEKTAGNSGGGFVIIFVIIAAILIMYVLMK